MGRLCGKELLDRKLTKYKSGTLLLDLYQTEVQFGEKVQFHGANNDREEDIEGDMYCDAGVVTLTVI